MGPGRSNQHSSHVDGQQASAHNLPALYIYRVSTPTKLVYSEPLSVIVPVVIGTCTVLVGTVLPIPVPPHIHILEGGTDLIQAVHLCYKHPARFFPRIQPKTFSSSYKLTIWPINLTPGNLGFLKSGRNFEALKGARKLINWKLNYSDQSIKKLSYCVTPGLSKLLNHWYAFKKMVLLF